MHGHHEVTFHCCFANILTQNNAIFDLTTCLFMYLLLVWVLPAEFFLLLTFLHIFPLCDQFLSVSG